MHTTRPSAASEHNRRRPLRGVAVALRLGDRLLRELVAGARARRDVLDVVVGEKLEHVVVPGGPDEGTSVQSTRAREAADVLVVCGQGIDRQDVDASVRSVVVLRGGRREEAASVRRRPAAGVEGGRQGHQRRDRLPQRGGRAVQFAMAKQEHLRRFGSSVADETKRKEPDRPWWRLAGTSTMRSCVPELYAEALMESLGVVRIGGLVEAALEEQQATRSEMAILPLRAQAADAKRGLPSEDRLLPADVRRPRCRGGGPPDPASWRRRSRVAFTEERVGTVAAAAQSCCLRSLLHESEAITRRGGRSVHCRCCPWRVRERAARGARCRPAGRSRSRPCF